MPRVRAERERLNEKLRKLTKAWIENLVDEAHYERHKAQVEFDLTALVVPEADMVAEAGKLIRRLPSLWAGADVSERRHHLLTLLDAVYVDARSGYAVLSIKPKAAFEAVLAGSPSLDAAAYA